MTKQKKENDEMKRRIQQCSHDHRHHQRRQSCRCRHQTIPVVVNVVSENSAMLLLSII